MQMCLNEMITRFHYMLGGCEIVECKRLVLLPRESVLYVNGYPVNCDNKVTNLIMSVGEM